MTKQGVFFSAMLTFLTVSQPAMTAEVVVSGGVDSSVSCIQSVCGENDPFAHPFDKSSGYKKQTDELIQRQFGKDLKNYMGRLMHQKLLKHQAAKAIFANKEKLSILPEVNGVIQGIKYFTDFNKYASAIEYVDFKYQYNAEKLKVILANEPEKYSAILALNDGRLDNLLKRSRLFNLKLEEIFKILEPNQVFIQAQQKYANSIININKSFYGIFPNLSSLIEIDQALIKAQNGERLSYTEREIFKNKLMDLVSMPIIISKEFSKIPLDKTPVELISETETKYFQSSSAKAVANPITIKQIFKDTVMACSDKLSYAYAALPTETQLNDFKLIYNQVHKTAVQLVEEKNKQSIGNALDIDLILPFSRTEMMSSVSSQLKQRIISEEKFIDALKKIDLTNIKNLEYLLLMLLMSSDNEFLSTATEFCDQAKSPKLDDAALSKYKILHLSWPTIQYPKIGASIAAHEIGHVVSANFSNLTIPEKNCLESKQNSKQYIEEDFADLFAAEIFNRLNYKVEKKSLENMSCGLLGRQKNTWSKGTIVNPDTDDTHSANFYRLLAFASSTVGLTNQCKTTLIELKETRFDNYCKWVN